MSAIGAQFKAMFISRGSWTAFYLKQALAAVGEFIVTKIGGLANSVLMAVGGFVSEVLDTVGNAFLGWYDTAVSYFEGLWNYLLGWVDKVVGILKIPADWIAKIGGFLGIGKGPGPAFPAPPSALAPPAREAGRAAGAMPWSPQVTYNVTNNVTAPPGMNPDALAGAIDRHTRRTLADQNRRGMKVLVPAKATP
jgi:hypothetical protein